MRRIFLLAICAAFIGSTQLFAQTVKIQLKTGEEKQVVIMASGNDQLFVQAGNIKFKEIASITFTRIEDASAKLQADLKKAGVIVLIDGVVREEARPIAELQKENTQSIEGFEKSIEQFRIQRTNAKTAQLVGMLALGGSLVLQSIYNNQYENDLEEWAKSPSGSAPKAKYVSPIIPVVGLGVFTIGIAIDLGASKHLEKR